MSQKRRWNVIALFGIIALVFLLGGCPQGKTGTAIDFAPNLSPGSGPSAVPYFDSEPHFDLNVPVPADVIKVEVLVADSVSGTVVDGTKLVVCYAGTERQATNVLSVVEGKVTARVSPNKRYDFYLLGEKGKWAGSLIENYYVDERGGQNLTMLQFKHGQITRGVTPPRIEKVMGLDISFDLISDITDGYTINDAVKHVYVEFTSKVGAVEDVAWSGFGAKLGIGAVPSGSSGIYGYYIPDSDPNDGIFKSKYFFDIKKAFLPNGDTELVIVGYDIANNRVEKHIPVKFNKTPAGNDLANAEFDDPFIIMERVPFTNNTFSADPDQGLVQLGAEQDINPAALMPIGGENSSYMAVVVFQVVDKTTSAKIPIIGFDLYRKERGASDEFKFVSRTHYDAPKTEIRRGWKVHQGFDTSSELEEGKEYEYKIKAFTSNGSLESSVLTGKIMESFTYTLEEPENRKQVPIAQASDISYSCKISNPKLLTKAEADWCDLGILIMDGQGDAAFGSKFRYVFGGGDGTPDLWIDTIGFDPGGVKRFSYKQHLAAPLQNYYGIIGLNDLIKVDSSTGLITITDKFVKIPNFNLVAGTPMEYQAGVSYQWDIQDWGGSPYSLNDDRALRIVKMYGTNQSRSMGNNRSSGSNAVNGRFTFVITE